MKKFLKKLLLFALVFFLLDKVFFVLLGYSAGLEADKRLEMAINGEINKDIIILGSSRGARNIIASQLEKATGTTAYNLSYPGSDVEFHDFLLKTVIKFNSKPKVVVLTVDAGNPGQFEANTSIKYRLDRLYPLVKYDYVVDELVNRGEKNALLAKLFMLHRLNKSNFDIRQKHFRKLDTIQPDGSMPITFQDKKEDWKFSEPKPYDAYGEMPAKVAAFKNIVRTCTDNNIKLLILFSPNLTPYNKSFEARIRELDGKDVNYYVYDANNPVYKNKDYYYDKQHLMANGAAIFTAEVGACINTRKSALNLGR